MNSKFFFLCLVLTSAHSFSQSDISGYIPIENTGKKVAIVNLIQLNEETSELKESTKIIASSATDAKGYFHFSKNLPYQSRFYYVSVSQKDSTIRSKKFLLGNEDSIFFKKSAPPLNKYKSTSLSDTEWRKFKIFQNKINKKKKFLEEIRAYSKDSLQILAVKLVSIRELEKKQLLDKDIALNKVYYALLLKELKESDMNPVEYLFFELKLAKFKIKNVEESYSISKSLNFMLGFLILGMLFFVYRSRTSKQTTAVLSKQELAIKNLILEKKSNKEIATELFISVSTVKTHITNLYKKLAVVNRTELVTRFTNSKGTST